MQGVLDPQGPIGQAELVILFDALAIMLAVIVPVIVLTLAFAWWFREGNSRARRLPDWSYSGRIEMIVWSIPALVVLFLGGIGWISAHRLDPKAPIASQAEPIAVEVVSLDWKWLFIYPAEGIASVNRLVVPAGQPIRFRLTSGTVMNSFFVPQLGSQIYTMATMTTQLNLQADRPGSFAGLSAQFSGDGFSDMRFTVDAVDQGGFRNFVTEARSTGQPLDADAYQSLARPGVVAQPLTFAAVEPGLFDRIAADPDGSAADPAGSAAAHGGH